MSNATRQVAIGEVVAFQNEGRTKTGRVIGLYWAEEILRRVRKAVVISPDGPVMVAVPVEELEPATGHEEHSATDVARSSAYLIDSAWYPPLDERTAYLLESVFLDFVKHEITKAPGTSWFTVALVYDHILRSVLEEHRRLRRA
ncbi:hypothetical protein [Streptomyces albogriseolus]|uniref:hypothetical protein n=1 Tax=Streptomyces albogriseolus TaxID=1887 RepID=UPI003460A92F